MQRKSNHRIRARRSESLVPGFQEPHLELVMALFTPHQTTPNPTKNLFARASPGTKQRAMLRMVRRK